MKVDDVVTIVANRGAPLRHGGYTSHEQVRRLHAWLEKNRSSKVKVDLEELEKTVDFLEKQPRSVISWGPVQQIRRAAQRIRELLSALAEVRAATSHKTAVEAAQRGIAGDEQARIWTQAELDEGGRTPDPTSNRSPPSVNVCMLLKDPDGKEYTAEEISAARAVVIELRDAGIKIADFSRVVPLSHSIAMLSGLADLAAAREHYYEKEMERPLNDEERALLGLT